jgi:uncharacterized tellurite resistance protein B-like protein
MLFQCSNRFDEGSIYISCTRKEFNKFQCGDDVLTNVLNIKTGKNCVYGTIDLGKITITLTREFDEEDKNESLS